MSYILDALKKSEKERQRGTVPDLLTMQEVILHKEKRRKVWPYAVVFAVALCISVSAYWLTQGRTKQKTGNVNVATVQQPVAEAPKSLHEEPAKTGGLQTDSQKAPGRSDAAQGPLKAPVETAKRMDKVPVKDAPRVEPRTIVAKGAVENRSSVNEVANVQSVRPAAKPEASSVETASKAGDVKPVHNDPPPVPGRIYHLEELPATVKQNMPPVNMSIFMYSEDPSSRMVRINGQTYREGQSVGEGLKLEEIRPDGVIINYRNYRLQIGQKP